MRPHVVSRWQLIKRIVGADSMSARKGDGGWLASCEGAELNPSRNRRTPMTPLERGRTADARALVALLAADVGSGRTGSVFALLFSRTANDGGAAFEFAARACAPRRPLLPPRACSRVPRRSRVPRGPRA